MKVRKNASKIFLGSWVIVTGGSRGIGKAISLDFASEGANVIFIYLKNHKTAKKTLEELKLFNVEAQGICLDVSNYDLVQKEFRKIINCCKKIDILVNCAGINRDKVLKKMTKNEWDQVINTNLTGCFNCSKAVIKNMISNNYGRIINISSIISLTGNFGQTNYSASKSGINGFTKSLALETAQYGITINSVCPGFTETDMLKKIPKKIKENFLNNIPKGRFGVPEDISNVVKFLAFRQSDYVTGQIIHVNGGHYM